MHSEDGTTHLPTAPVPRPARIGKRKLWRLDKLCAWVAAEAPYRERWEELKREAGVRDG